MKTLMILHEVDNVDHWLKSPRRGQFFGPAGIKVRTFVDPSGTNRVGLIADLPDSMSMDDLTKMLQTPEAADAMKFDGVHPESIVMLAES